MFLNVFFIFFNKRQFELYRIWFWRTREKKSTQWYIGTNWVIFVCINCKANKPFRVTTVQTFRTAFSLLYLIKNRMSTLLILKKVKWYKFLPFFSPLFLYCLQVCFTLYIYVYIYLLWVFVPQVHRCLTAPPTSQTLRQCSCCSTARGCSVTSVPSSTVCSAKLRSSHRKVPHPHRYSHM